MRFGTFDDRNREYVITRPDTPLPWINYLGNQDFFGIISNTAGGYTFYKDARLRRLTRYRYNNLPLDTGGRYLYLRDQGTGEYWSPSWKPTCSPLEDYTCRHGMGYTRIGSTYKQIQVNTRYFIPMDQNLEIWQVEITNQRSVPANLALFSIVEFCLWDANDDATNYQRNYNTGQVEIEGSVIYHKTEYRERRNHFAYFACSEPLNGYETQRSEFFGPNRGWDRPLAVEAGQLHNTEAHGWSPIGAHQINLILAPGETRKLVFLLGYHENPVDQKFDPPSSQIVNKKTVLPVIQRFTHYEEADKAFNELKRYWDGLFARFQVNTPDEHTNRMVNIWNAYQCMITFNMSRSASLYESGIGRGMGFRDSNQDLLGFVHMVPERARQRILDLSATQMDDGSAYHQYQPLTRKGNNDVGSNFNDDPLWLILGVSAYIKESGDWSILDEPVQYDNRPGSEKPLYDHLLRSFQYTLDRLGPHNLPLIGRADWNDCLNLNCFSTEPGQSFQTTTNKDGKVAESVFIAGLFVLAGKELAGIAAHLGQKELVQKCLAAAQSMDKTIHTSGWDGDWFIRAYDDNSSPVGSHECNEGQIYIEPQGMCVMAGVGLEDGLAARALASVNQRLATKHGIVLQQPAYTHYYLNLGEISSYPPGYKENAGIFCHTNPWIMIAETMTGNGDRAFDYYSRINPSRREEISELHACEPYVYAQMIAGKDAPTHGEAKNSWLSGTAAWNYVAITQHILGIRPTLEGLQIAPTLPSDWKEFSAQRIFRGCLYKIEVKRNSATNQLKLWVDGKAIQGNVIPLPASSVKEISVVAEIG